MQFSATWQKIATEEKTVTRRIVKSAQALVL